MPLPGLHVVTSDEVLAARDFADRATALIQAHGPAVALHLRGHATPVPRLLDLAHRLVPLARESGSLLLLNDRADIALATGADGVQLGQQSIPVASARSLRRDWVIGASVHSVAEAGDAAGPGRTGADFLLLGTIWETPSHAGREGAGPELIREVRRVVGMPIIAIGGVTPERAAVARGAGAEGVAVIRGVWESDDPAAAAAEYVEAVHTGAER